MARGKKKGLQADLIAAATGKHSEPEWNILTPPGKLELAKALNFYNYNFDEKAKKKWAMAWLKKHRPELYSQADKAPMYMFATFAVFMRMESRGLVLEDKYKAQMIEWAESLGPRKSDDDEDEKPKPVKIKKVRLDFNMQALDDILDAVLSGEELVPEFDSSKPFGAVIKYCEEQLELIREDNQQYPKHMKKFFKSILERANSVAQIVKTRKVVRKPRKVDPLKMTAKVKYSKRYEDLKIDGMKPSEVVGKKKLFIFDTKYRRFFKLAATEAGFVFSGTTLANIDLAKSSSKTVRKPEEALKSGMGIRELDRSYGLIKGKEFELTGVRFNDNILIINAS